MSELTLLAILLGVAFVVAPLMTNDFYLAGSQTYRKAHIASVLVVSIGVFVLETKALAAVWPAFCAIGFLLHLRNVSASVLTVRGLAACLPFVFSLISSLWFVAGTNDLGLLGYDPTWSFYAALHGAFLGWIFVGCIAYIAMNPSSSPLFLWGCFASFFMFLCVAFGIDGVPYIKRIGVVGFSILVPGLIAIFQMNARSARAKMFASLSLLSIVVTMILALANEFWPESPRMAFGLPIMALVHGVLNAVVTVPFFYLAVKSEQVVELGDQ